MTDFVEWDKLTIKNDFLFSKLMRDKEVCKKVIEVLLKFKIKDIVYLEEEKSIDIEIGSKSVRLDVYVEDGNKVYNIEMQVADTKNLPKRSRYYQGMIDLNTIEKGEMYNNLKETYVVFICMFDPFDEGLPKYSFENICSEKTDLKLNDGTHKVFFNTDAYNEETDEDIKAFLQYVKGEKSNNNFIDFIDEKVEHIKHSNRWRREYMTLYMKFQEIADESKIIGRREGREEGIVLGMEKGREEGMFQERLAMAKKLLGMLPEDAIMKTTGLSLEELQALKNEQ